MFFHLCPQEAIISDTNPELINCYLVVRDNVDELIELLTQYPHDKDFFYSEIWDLVNNTIIEQKAKEIFEI